LHVTGTDAASVSGVTVGGVAQAFTSSLGDLAVEALAESTPLCTPDLTLAVAAGTSAPARPLTVVHLVINELDVDQVGLDTTELVEVATGLDACPDGADVLRRSLRGYALVFWNGANGQSYNAVDLDATTDANGLLVAGDQAVKPAPQIVLGIANLIQNGGADGDAVGLYQGTAADFAVGTPLTARGILDAVVYNAAGNSGTAMALLEALLPAGPGRKQLYDDTTTSLQRCWDRLERLDGRTFGVGIPSPGRPSSRSLVCGGL